MLFFAHLTFVIHIDDPETPFCPGKHAINICMANLAIWIVVMEGIVWRGGIGKVILGIIHVYILNTWHFIDDVKGVSQCLLIIFQHVLIQSTLNEHTYIFTILLNGIFNKLLVYHPENGSKR